MNENETDLEIDAALRRRFAPPAGLEERALAHVRGLAAPRTPRHASWPVAATLLALAAGILLVVRGLRPADDAHQPRAGIASAGVGEPIVDAPSPDGTSPVLGCAVGPLADPTSVTGDRIVRPDLEKIYGDAIAWAGNGLSACAGERWCSDEGDVCLKPDAAGLLAGPFSSEEWPTGTFWTGPVEDGSPVLVADLDATHACCLALELPEGSPLNVFTWRVADVTLTEITPRGEPRLLDCFESVRVR